MVQRTEGETRRRMHPSRFWSVCCCVSEERVFAGIWGDCACLFVFMLSGWVGGSCSLTECGMCAVFASVRVRRCASC